MEQLVTEKSNPLWYLFRKVWEYSAGTRWKLVTFWSMFVVAESITLFGYPFIMAQMMKMLVEQGITHQSFKALLMLLALRLLCTILFWSIHGPARVMERGNAFDVKANYRRHLMQGVLTLKLDWHTEHHSGDTIDKVEKGTNALFNFAEDTFEVIYALVQLLGTYCVLACYSKLGAGIAAVMMLVTATVVRRFDRLLVPEYTELAHAENKITESIFDSISNITTVIILRVEQYVHKAIMHKVVAPRPLFMRNTKKNEWKWFWSSLCCSFTTVMVFGIYLYQHKGVGPGVIVSSFYLLANYVGQVTDLFQRFTWMYGDIVQRKAKVLNSEELSEDFVTESFANHVLPADWRTVEVKNLNFSYGGDTQHLRDVQMTFRRGQRIAIIGKTGGGKSSFLKVVRDLYHPQSLDLIVDGVLVPEGFAGISRGIALVPQDAEIFATTIEKNLTCDVEYSMEVVKYFCDMAEFTEVVDSLPHGFQSSIKERGVNLSGGQQQRLALTRGLLACQDKNIVLLDEPTSNLDGITEMRIFQNIWKAFPDKTIVASVHRLHLLPLFDMIYFFDSGQIIAAGSLLELLEHCPLFVALWQQCHMPQPE